MIVSELTVSELIEFLKKQPQNLPVAYQRFSEQCLLEKHQIKIVELSHPRPDGWVEDPRPDKPSKKYLLLPGN